MKETEGKREEIVGKGKIMIEAEREKGRNSKER